MADFPFTYNSGRYVLTYPVLHGTTNAIPRVQSNLTAHISRDPRRFLLLWPEVILISAPSIEDLLKAIGFFFRLCSERILKFHPSKCVLYGTRIRRCGCLIAMNGKRVHPSRTDGIRMVREPCTGAQLQQFVCAMQWMQFVIIWVYRNHLSSCGLLGKSI